MRKLKGLMKKLDIRKAASEDLPGIRKLLRECKLPDEGLAEHLGTTIVVSRRDGDEVIGCAALEIYGDSALLRSVAIRPGWQSKGYGNQLTEAALDLARRNSVEQVYLLAETASRYFSRYGFEVLDRRKVAPSILQTKEFTTLCPETAIAMKLKFPKALQKDRDA